MSWCANINHIYASSDIDGAWHSPERHSPHMEKNQEKPKRSRVRESTPETEEQSRSDHTSNLEGLSLSAIVVQNTSTGKDGLAHREPVMDVSIVQSRSSTEHDSVQEADLAV